MALHALSEYSIKTYKSGLDLQCIISTNRSNFRKELTFQDANALVQQQVQVRYVAPSVGIDYVGLLKQSRDLWLFQCSFHAPKIDYAFITKYMIAYSVYVWPKLLLFGRWGVMG